MLLGSAFINLVFFSWQSSLVATEQMPNIFAFSDFELVGL